MVKILNQCIREVELDDNSVDLIVTSPPYNLGIDYGTITDELRYDDWYQFCALWMRKCYRWLKPDGRFCLNIPLDTNRGIHRPVGADLTTLLQEVGFKYNTTIIWSKGNISTRRAWGSWQSASAPCVFASVELIVVLYKDEWKKQNEKGVSDIDKQEFMYWTDGLWTFNGEQVMRKWHPAPFPIELPRRCIKLFSYVGDLVLDPFMGTGTTLVAAQEHSREAIGVEIDKSYCEIANERLRQQPLFSNNSLPKQINLFDYAETTYSID